MSRLIVTIAPPTPNGDLHLGHIAGPYMAADVYARVQRQKGHDVLFVSYSDDYQSYLQRKGRELGIEPFALGLRNGAMIHETLGMLDIRPDWWMQSGHNPHFRDAVRMFYEGAAARGAIGTRMHRMAYFPAFDVWGYEAYARGACNHCGTSSDASQCEHCAHAPDINRMDGLSCTLGASPLEWREVERDYLKVGMYREFLRDLYGRHPLRPNLRAFVDEVLALPDEDLEWYTTRPHECGVTIPTSGGDRVVHTWFSGIAGYYAASREYM
ncbi:MAG TPA: class I tRNA ligase family protein, partial [Arenibaculum sp.]|nr:class I tRNA ligase family protein [Arenibaculum sp.]